MDAVTQLYGLLTTSITGALTLTKTGTTARTATFPDASITVAGSASALTSGRVPYVTTGGLLTDSADILAKTGPLAGTTTEYGAYLNLTSSGTRNTTRTLQVDYTINAVTGASDAGTAIWANAKSGGSINCNHFVGVQSYADHAGSGTVGSVYGFNTYLFNSGGGTITNLYGLNIVPPVTMTGVGTAYGIYMGDFTASMYTIYTGTGIARLGGTLTLVGAATLQSTLNTTGLATFSGGAVFGTDPGGTASLRVGGAPDSTYGNINVSDTTAMAAGVGGVVSLAGKYTSGGAYANFVDIKGVKVDGVSGNFNGKLIVRVQKGASPYMTEVLNAVYTQIGTPLTTDATTPTDGALYSAGGLSVAKSIVQPASTGYHYFGPSGTDGSVRIYGNGSGALIIEKRASGSWTEIGRFA